MSSAAEREPYGAFLDRTREPSRASVLETLGRARAAWDDLEAHLTETYALEGSFHFMYGPRFGWAIRFQRSGRLVMAIYPNRGKFTAQVVLGQAQVAAAQRLDLSPRVMAVLKAATSYPEGRWLFIPVTSLRGARELRPLLALKVSRPKRGPTTGSPKVASRSHGTRRCQ